MARRPGGNEAPAPDFRTQRHGLTRVTPDLHRATSRIDPNVVHPGDPPDLGWPDDVVGAFRRTVDDATSRIPPGKGDVFGAGDNRTRDPVPFIVQGRRFRHHQPYTTGQRGPHR